MFSTSDKVVCVNDRFTPDVAAWFTGLPKRGAVYVVRGVDERGTRNGVYLVGIRGDIWFDGTERGFCPTRFRKLAGIQAENASALCANKVISPSAPDEPS